MTAEILCVGTELLLGDIVNTNASYIAKELARIGINLYHQSVVGDNHDRLISSVKDAFENADILITTGGLGPTYDDLTKETVADYFNKSMYLDKESLDRIEHLFKSIHRPVSENNKKQAMIPEGAIVLKNDYGTAPGIILEENGKTAILLPGPPREMKPMFDNLVLPYLEKKSGKTFVSKNINIFGLGEAMVENMLRPLILDLKNPTVAPYAKEGEMLLRLTACADTEKEANEIIDPYIKDITNIIGAENIYGIDAYSLQNALVKALSEKNLKVATAESCTGGLISKRITEIPGSSKVFELGICTYSNDAKVNILGVNKDTIDKFGAVSYNTAVEMAQCIRKIANADIGLGVSGIAGPESGDSDKPVGLVYVAVSSKTIRT
ncbi:MAG: competence/damage-inducible protein A [Eubacteriales bacterium]